jgi:hypothetical protein
LKTHPNTLSRKKKRNFRKDYLNKQYYKEHKKTTIKPLTGTKTRG